MSVWYLKSGSTYIELPEPQSYDIDGEDLDLDSYRSIITGDIVRNILGYKWQKLQVGFPFKTHEEAKALIDFIKNTYPLTINAFTPFAESEDGFMELKGYVSKVRCECKPYRVSPSSMELGWIVSFNFVEGIRQ